MHSQRPRLASGSFSGLGRATAAPLLLCIALITTYFLYSNGFTGEFFFDDEPNLGGLSQIHDTNSAIAFVLSGNAGPGGRPIALASFLLNTHDWPDHPGAFVRVNVLVHMLNGILLIWLTLLIARQHPTTIKFPEYFAIALGALWMLHPFLASTSLMPVQRMTSLAATFVLGGLILYVVGRINIHISPYKSLLIMSAGIGIGSILATLSKENGILLPIYALVVETTLLRSVGVARADWFIWWKRAFLILPALVIVAYIAVSWPSLQHSYMARGFTPEERLLTSPRILLEYLRNILLPQRSSISPFHDDYELSTGWLTPPSTLAFILVWIGLAYIAWAARRRAPIITFGLLWFVTGHSLEGTILPLELYFEHRNYLPAIGPLATLCVAIWMTPQNLKILASSALLIYIITNAFVLREVTAIWGQPMISAEIWAMEKPQSARASQYLANQYLSVGDADTAHKVIVTASNNSPDNATLIIQTLFACDKFTKAEFDHAIAIAVETGGTGDFGISTALALERLVRMHFEGTCNHLEASHIHDIADALLRNPMRKNGTRQRIYAAKGSMHAKGMDFHKTIYYLDLAYNERPAPIYAQLVTTTLLSAGLRDEAIQYIEEAKSNAKTTRGSIYNKKVWENQYEEIRRSLAGE